MLFDDNIVLDDLELRRENYSIKRKELIEGRNDRIGKFRIEEDPIVMIYKNE